MISVTVSRADGKRLKRLPAVMREALAHEMNIAMIALQSYIQTAKLSGQVLHRRSGDLSEAIWPETKVLEDGVQGRVYVRPNAWYGRVHEYGGTFSIPAHQSTMTKVFGKPVKPFQVRVREHTATYPERAFMRSSLADMRGFILDRLRKGFQLGLARA